MRSSFSPPTLRPKFPFSTCSSSRRVAKAVFTLVAAHTLPTAATASPIPAFFLDFLYPQFAASRSRSDEDLSAKSSPRPESRSPSPPASSLPSTPGTRAAIEDDSESQLESPSVKSQKRRRQAKEKARKDRPKRSAAHPLPTPPPVVKRDTVNGLKVPIKYESVDGTGWVIDTSWDLHGHHVRAETDSTGDPVSLLTLNTTSPDPGGNSTTENGLDLPEGWQSSATTRHESYDPVIVSVFAVILVMSILATIGLCRWRAKKLRILRDLDKAEKGKTSSDDEDDEDGSSDAGSRFSEKSDKAAKKKKNAGSASAIRKRFARFRRRHRSKRDGNTEKVDNTNTSDDEDCRVDSHTNSDVRRSVDVSSIAGSRSSTVTGSILENASSPDAALNSTTAMESVDAIPPPNERDREAGRLHPRITITVTGSDMLSPTETPNAEPPAYPTSSDITDTIATGNGSTGRSRTTSAGEFRIREKAPILGLEAEYDNRDLTSYRATTTSLHLSTPRTGSTARSSAPPTRRPSRVRFVGDATDAQQQHPDAERGQVSEEEQPAPSFEPFPETSTNGVGTSMSLVSRVAAGATLRAHVATDDKELLRRLRELADEPAVETEGSVASAPPIMLERDDLLPPPPMIDEGDADILSSTVHMPAEGRLAAHAPSFSEMEQWELERQMELTQGASSLRITPLTTNSATGSAHPDSSTPSADRSLRPPATHAIPVITSLPSPPSRLLMPYVPGGSTANGFLALPPPPSPVSSIGEPGDVGYGLGTVWSSLNMATATNGIAPGMSGNNLTVDGRIRTPSAPPSEFPGLVPSAPPQDVGDGIGVPSAPPAWDEDEDEPAMQGTIREPLALHTALLRAHAPEVDALNASDRSVAVVVPGGDAEIDEDGSDGANSVISTPPDNEDPHSRWSATFRTRASEGAGLPKYEP